MNVTHSVPPRQQVKLPEWITKDKRIEMAFWTGYWIGKDAAKADLADHASREFPKAKDGRIDVC